MLDRLPYAVAHFRTPFLSLSETFIYSYLTHFPAQVTPYLFTNEIQNRDQFPFTPIFTYSFKKFSWRWWLNGLSKRCSNNKQPFLERMLKKNRISLLHAHFGPEGWALLNMKRKLNLPLITTFYGYDASYLAREFLWRERYAELFQEGDLFLVEGPRMKKRLEGLGCPAQKIRVQRIAVDLKKITYRLRRPKTEGRLTFLFCGRLVEKKGLMPALHAFRNLAKEGVSGFEFRVIGDGEGMAQAREFLQQENLASHVHLLGFQPHRVFYDELNRADVFVAPSVVSQSGDSEGGAPTTLLEAQAAGLPVVSTYHDDIPYVVIDGESALLSAERDIAQLKNNIRFFIENPKALAYFGRSGRDHIERRHNIELEAENLSQLYETLLKRPSKAPPATASPISSHRSLWAAAKN